MEIQNKLRKRLRQKVETGFRPLINQIYIRNGKKEQKLKNKLVMKKRMKKKLSEIKIWVRRLNISIAVKDRQEENLRLEKKFIKKDRNKRGKSLFKNGDKVKKRKKIIKKSVNNIIYFHIIINDKKIE
jgi:hypothetical protein